MEGSERVCVGSVEWVARASIMRRRRSAAGWLLGLRGDIASRRRDRRLKATRFAHNEHRLSCHPTTVSAAMSGANPTDIPAAASF
jgi:hypothetical protein